MPVEVLKTTFPTYRAQTLAGGLERHSDIRVVTRDRSTEYSRGAYRFLPITDRWHSLVNIDQAVEREPQGAPARLKRLSPDPRIGAFSNRGATMPDHWKSSFGGADKMAIDNGTYRRSLWIVHDPAATLG
ncbi:hypothetical protein FV226_22090 [Methylobacterium sp. WL12]|uniref:hypothetical protein n=1 Tax=Methylobacterium sp. WL12 TaxID=2603890 RepID=UPI0011CB19D2|nr:hypothetical protein [Methylobacterium sp. WL12]TXM67331.1 hypothetical protein FV226_22090 [Methylobacterium sp. WL12]